MVENYIKTKIIKDMNKNEYVPAKIPTIYFIGVTTSKSSIMQVFPEWANYLKLGECRIKGIDFLQHDDPDKYKEAVDFIKKDKLSLGALVTTHKIDLLKACKDKFEKLDEFAQLMEEISCISKQGGKLYGHAKDPITSGLSLEAIIPKNYWKDTGAEVLILGAGGSSIALTWYIMTKTNVSNRPSKIYVTNRSLPRLEEMKMIHKQLKTDIEVEYFLSPSTEINDQVLSRMKPGSLVINATGLGKDGPGSPLSNNCVFPVNGIAWDFNYRGDLIFLDQARAQAKKRNLTIEDGWIYFIHGWTRVIAEVFHIDIPTEGKVLNALSSIAAKVRK